MPLDREGTMRTAPHWQATHRRTDMERQQILDLYQWETGVCFRHPGEGEQPTARLSTLRPRGRGAEEVRACRGCVAAIEAERREAADVAGLNYEPGHAGESLGD